MASTKRIYIPMTADVLHVGHVRLIKECAKMGLVFIGLLSRRALKGYKEVVIPFTYRKELLEAIVGVHRVIPQHSMSPENNLKAYEIDIIASGDGWENDELVAIKKAGVEKIDVKLPGETKGKQFSSTKIKEKICQKFLSLEGAGL